MKKLTKKQKRILSVQPLILILLSILIVFIISRTITYLVLVKELLPKNLFLDINGFRLHHFVYGNILIMVTSFLAIGLGVRKHKNLFAIAYGIGLGLILDEFLLWIGDITQLTSSSVWIPHSTTVIAIVSLLIASLIMIRLYRKEKK